MKEREFTFSARFLRRRCPQILRLVLPVAEITGSLVRVRGKFWRRGKVPRPFLLAGWPICAGAGFRHKFVTEIAQESFLTG